MSHGGRHDYLTQSTPLLVEWGLVVLDVPGLQHAASLDVVVGVNHHGLG